MGMKQDRYAIGLDLGTSAVKAVLFSPEKGVAAKGSGAFTYAPARLPDGAGYLGIDMENFYRTICGVLRDLAEKIPNGASFCGLAMASASGNGLLCDKAGNALIHAYSWLTPAMNEEIAAVFGAGFGPDVRESAGWGLAPSFPLGQFSHLRVHAPDLLDRADVVCMTTEYVLHRLTGKWGIDVSTATPFYFLDQKKRAWNKTYLDTLGIPESKLPPLFESGDLLGELTEQGAADTGLPAGARVFLGSFDHPTAARACDIEKEGDLLISCGTSWVCFFPVDDRARIMARGLSADPFLTPDGPWGTICSLARAGERLEELTRRFFGEGPDRYDLRDKYAAASPRGANGLSFNPFAELPDLAGYSKADISRAMMEGTARALKARMGDIVKVERITMCGGPSESPVWPRVLEDVFGVPVRVTYGPHSGAVGAAMYALK